MAENSGIDWTEHTWNPVIGCDKVSPGCDNCYAEALTKRFAKNFPNGFAVTLKPHRMNEPAKWKVPSFVFVNSMSDLFHREIPPDYLRQIWQVMLDNPQHVYQVLTKRAHRMVYTINNLGLELAPHIWLGVSAENQQMANSRIPELLKLDTTVRWVSAEPLLGPVDMSNWISDLQWVVVGGESGQNHRNMDYQWVRDIRDQCVNADTAFFYKQGMAFRPGRDRILDGRTWGAYPVIS